jgi:hypothetical protein
MFFLTNTSIVDKDADSSMLFANLGRSRLDSTWIGNVALVEMNVWDCAQSGMTDIHMGHYLPLRSSGGS